MFISLLMQPQKDQDLHTGDKFFQIRTQTSSKVTAKYEKWSLRFYDVHLSLSCYTALNTANTNVHVVSIFYVNCESAFIVGKSNAEPSIIKNQAVGCHFPSPPKVPCCLTKTQTNEQ